jgi:hypothetical protein
MKISYIAILILGIMLSGPVSAKIYRYVDDNGQANFTDDLSTVPESKRAKVTEQEEIQSSYHPSYPNYSNRECIRNTNFPKQ